MRTTVVLPDELYRQVKARALAENRTVTSFLEDALRREIARTESVSGPVDIHLAPPTGSRDEPPLVDLTDKGAVEELLDEDDFTIRQVRDGVQRA